MRGLGLLLAVVVSAGITQAASAVSEERVAIRLGVGIGPINLGMTGQDVRRALGRPETVKERRVIRGQPYTELTWGGYSWNVGLIGRKGHRRVVLVGTTLGRHRTRDGLGVGTREAPLWRKLRGRIDQRVCWEETRQTHWVVRQGNAETIFFPYSRPTRVPTMNPPLVVGAVEVRARPVFGCVV